jgi:hypothetical protein
MKTVEARTFENSNKTGKKVVSQAVIVSFTLANANAKVGDSDEFGHFGRLELIGRRFERFGRRFTRCSR